MFWLERKKNKMIIFFKSSFLKLFIIGIFITLSWKSIAQHHEFGLGPGMLNYAGDLQRGYQLSSIRPGGQLFYRYNFNPVISLRGSLMAGGLAGSDKNPIDPFAAVRNNDFGLTVVELSGDFEYNFLDTKSKYSRNNWTPYLFLGLGAFYMIGDEPVNGEGQYSSIQPVIPFGTGLKFDINPYININVEFGLRKLFTDWVDDVSDARTNTKNFQYGNKYDKDWYNFFGITLTYTIYRVDCPYDFYDIQPLK